ncbi:UNVERIFIED_CONTAM: hypothetical protein PYX00_010190 [Menopon gallinae]|uniref:Rap guanine nucleotide exchange factor 4 n=1 Tax=Menopon gallinae TaxID=328185 RepID=A0AAW2HET1_9NEOP
MWPAQGSYHLQTGRRRKGPVTLRYLGAGTTFGESILDDHPRNATIVTQTTCELFRVKSADFKLVWEKNKDVMTDLVGNSKLRNGYGGNNKGISGTHCVVSKPKTTTPPDIPDPALPIVESPSAQMSHIGWVLRTILLGRTTVLRERKSQGRVIRRCATGSELIDWLCNVSETVYSRQQAQAMWQALLEEGVVIHASREHVFKDKCLLYQFWQDEEGAVKLPTAKDVAEAEECLLECLSMLAKRAPDAVLRLILRKPSHERTPEELEMIYEELIHITALAHLSNSVKRELAGVILFEAHTRAGTILFEQGDVGRSWYIILRGSVDVVIHGKGSVTVLQEGDDFGKLALINDSPRAATIVLKENNCHFLRVDKEDFDRILRDVEANTVRLQEHGKDVLVLEKVTQKQNQKYVQKSQFKYVVMAGTPEKMLEHLLETRMDGRAVVGGKDPTQMPNADHFVDDFLLTFVVFMTTEELVDLLRRHYHMVSPTKDRDYTVTSKKRVIRFIHRWVVTIKNTVFENPVARTFLQELAKEVETESGIYRNLEEEASLMHHITALLNRHDQEMAGRNHKWKLPPCGQPVTLFSGPSGPQKSLMKPHDDIIFRVYCADHTYCTLRMPLNSTAETIKLAAADRLKLRNCDDLALAEVKSSGERVVINDQDVNVPTALTLNGRIFVSPRDHLDALTIVPEQEKPTECADNDIELFSTKELAYHMTLFDWDLFSCVHEYELVYHVMGKHRFGELTANLEVFLRRFNEVQYWVATEILLTQSLGKRVTLLRKLIKLASYCKEYQNFNAFLAIMMGLSNQAVSRLSLTWEKLPNKFRKMFTEYELLMDPSRNHRAYRVAVGKLQPPVLPFMPLLIKDMTFTQEGNKTYADGLVNFEKMHLFAQTLRTLRYSRSRHLILEPPSPKSEANVRSYISCLRVVDNQKHLTSLSQKLEPRRS